MEKFKRVLFVLFLTLISTPLHGIGEQTNSETSHETVEVHTPNPIDLQANWLTYFEVNREMLEKRVKDVNNILDSFKAQLETPEEKQEAESLLKEFQSHLESLMLLKKQELEKPSLAWLPKKSYSLDDYIVISDQIRDLSLDISVKNADLQRFKYSANNIRQSFNSTYAKYLSLSGNSKEKFLQGLEVMSLGARLLYLEAEIEIGKSLIEIDQQLLKRYRAEQGFINKELKIEVNLQGVGEEKEKLSRELSSVHAELLGLEAQSIKTFAEQNGYEASRIVNQKLTNSLIKEELIKSKLFLLDAESKLYKSINQTDELVYSIDVEPIKTFRDNTRKQLVTWEQVITDEIDQLSQTLVKVNGEGAEEQKISAYEDRLKLSLLNKAFLAALSKELYHIKLVLGLIDQNVLERQTVLDQISYYFQSSWHWFSEFFGGWFYYSLFDIGGVPITLMGLFKAVLIVLVSVWISRFMGRALKRLSKKKGGLVEPTLYTFRRIIHYLILIIGCLFALASLGLTMRNMAIVLGALSIGIGFGLQNIVNNFLCGLAILFERNVKIGDFVELESGHIGKITEVNVQNTTIHTFDGLDVLVPNSSIIGSNVVNWTKKDPYQRLHVPFGVAYGTEQAKVSEVVRQSALKIPFTMTESQGVNGPEVWLVEFGDSSLNFELVVWVNIYKARGKKAMRAEYLSEIELALKENNIHIPFPQRDLHLKTLPSKDFQITK